MCFSVFILVLEKEQKMFLLISSTYFFKNPTKFLKLKKNGKQIKYFYKKACWRKCFRHFFKTQRKHSPCSNTFGFQTNILNLFCSFYSTKIKNRKKHFIPQFKNQRKKHTKLQIKSHRILLRIFEIFLRFSYSLLKKYTPLSFSLLLLYFPPLQLNRRIKNFLLFTFFL